VRYTSSSAQAGYTLVELLVVIALSSIIGIMLLAAFNRSFVQYLSIQQSGSNFTGLDAQAQRIGNVLRGLTDIVTASNNSLTVYAYFAPADTYVSQIRYLRM
jgi:prepilin-type N-terminal cleavage/methylation domain-containing protein